MFKYNSNVISCRNIRLDYLILIDKEYRFPDGRVLYQAETTTPYPGFILAPVDIYYKISSM